MNAPADNTSPPPPISVLCAVHNGEAFIEESVRSILTQTFKGFELVLLNDGATDRTPQILDGLAREDSRIRVFHRENRGLTRTLSEGLTLCRGALIARQDDDDISLPARLALQKAFMDAHPEIAITGCRYRSIDVEGRIIGNENVPLSSAAIKRGLLTHNVIAHSGAMFRREAVLKLGGYDETYTTAQDYDLWCRAALHHELANLPSPLLHRRKHPHQIGVKATASQRANRNKIRNAYRLAVIHGENTVALPFSVRALARLYEVFDFTKPEAAPAGEKK